MNWVQNELKRTIDPRDDWLTCYPSRLYGVPRDSSECDHRWAYKLAEPTGFYRLPVRQFCARCGVEA